MDLAELQRALQALIAGRYLIDAQTPDYIREVAASEHLAMVREVIRWWRAFQVRSLCVFTARTLQRAGRFDEVLDTVMREQPLSPFIEEFGAQFLQYATADDDPLVSRVARYELSMLRVKKGECVDTEVEWDRDPESVLEALMLGTQMPPPDNLST